MTFKATILGCGASGGVPLINGQWGRCDPNDPRNRRTRCSLVIQKSKSGSPFDPQNCTTVLIDTSPDLRSQLLREKIARIDALLYTHHHADQAHGIDDLRHIAYIQRRRIPTYMDDETEKTLMDRFRYCFRQDKGSAYPVILDDKRLPHSGQAFEINGPGGIVTIEPFEVSHGNINAFGFKCDRLIYSPDVSDIDDTSFEVIGKHNIWICDCLREEEHPSHAHLEKTLSWFDRAKIHQGILTNMHISLDYAAVDKITPDHVIPGVDGLTISWQKGAEDHRIGDPNPDGSMLTSSLDYFVQAGSA